jgi:hypothetical protein
MRTAGWVVLAFVAGFLVACGTRAPFEPQRAEAQGGGAKWEHKAFRIGGSGADLDKINQDLKEVDEGGWEYAFTDQGAFVFKRQKK